MNNIPKTGKDVTIILSKELKAPILENPWQGSKIFITIPVGNHDGKRTKSPYGSPDIPWISLTFNHPVHGEVTVAQSQKAWEKNYPDGAVQIIEK